MHVLMIEDNEDDYFLLKRSVSKISDVQIEWSDTLENGLAYIESHPVDLLLLDMNLPDGQGLNLFDRAHTRFPALPIVILSGSSTDEIALEAVQHGAQDYLVKGQIDAAGLGRSMRYALERKRAEERFRALLEAAPDATVIVNPRGSIEYVNSQTEKLFGYKREELLRQPVEMLIPDHLRDNFLAQRAAYFTDLRTQDNGVTLELVALRKDGSQFPAEISLRPIEISEGILVSSAVRDITERKQVEEKLRYSENQYRILASNLPDTAVLLFDTDMRYTLVEGTVLERAGYNRAQIEGKTLREVTSDETFRLIMPYYEAALRGETVSFERHLGGGYIFDIQIVPIRDTSGTIRGGMIVSRDITEQKRAEEALEAERRLLTILMDTIPDIIYFKDTASRFIRINQSHAHMLGANNPDDAVGKTDADFQDPALAKSFLAEEAIIVTSGQPLVNHEEYNPTPDDTPRWFSSTKMPIKDELGRVTEIVGISRDITSIKRAEQEGRRLQIALDGMVEGAQIIGFDWRYIYLNNASAAQIRRSKDELVGHTMMEMNPGIDQTPLFSIIQRCMKQRVSEHIESQYAFPDNTVGWYEIVIQPIPEGLFILSTDISERKKVEETVRESEEKLQTIFKMLPVGVSLMDNKKHTIQMNFALEKMMGMTLDDTNKGKHLSRPYLHGDGTPLLPEEFPSARAMAEQQVIFDAEMGFVREDGATVWASVSAAPLPGSQGVVTVMVDITEQKRDKQALAEERNLLRTLIDRIPDFVFIKDRQSRYLLANRAVLAAGNLTDSEQIIGKTDFNFSPPHIAQGYYDDDQEVMTTGQAVVNKEEMSVNMQTGEERWLLTTKVPLRDEQGRITSVLGVSRNITDSKRLQKENFDLELDRERFFLLSQFVRDTSHDIRTPLSIINTSTYMLRKLPADKQLERIEVIEAQVGAINTMLETIHYTAQLWSTDHFDLESVQLDRLIEDVGNLIGPQTSAKKQHLKIVTSPLTLMAEPTYLSQAFFELLDNASAFTPENGEIEVHQFLRDNTVLIEFKDTGIGMPAEAMSRAFDMFWKADDSRNDSREHPGLGLAIAHRIIELHHGSIRVESQPQVGTTFTVLLPIEVS